MCVFLLHQKKCSKYYACIVIKLTLSFSILSVVHILYPSIDLPSDFFSSLLFCICFLIPYNWQMKTHSLHTHTHFDGHPFIRFIIEFMYNFGLYQKSNYFGLYCLLPDVLDSTIKRWPPVTTSTRTHHMKYICTLHYTIHIVHTFFTSIPYWQIYSFHCIQCVHVYVNAHVYISISIFLLFVLYERWSSLYVGVNEVEYICITTLLSDF